MSRETLRRLLTGLSLALVLALAAPPRAQAAGFRDGPLGRTLMSFVPRWLVALVEKGGYATDPNGSPAPVKSDSGYQTDPNGSPAPPNPSTDSGYQIDPDG
jgi:hypothetical protein